VSGVEHALQYNHCQASKHTTTKYEIKTTGERLNQDSRTFSFSPWHPIHFEWVIQFAAIQRSWITDESYGFLLVISFVVCGYGGHRGLPHRQEPGCRGVFIQG